MGSTPKPLEPNVGYRLIYEFKYFSCVLYYPFQSLFICIVKLHSWLRTYCSLNVHSRNSMLLLSIYMYNLNVYLILIVVMTVELLKYNP